MKKLLVAMLILLSGSIAAADSGQKTKIVLEIFKEGFVSPLKDIKVSYLIPRMNKDDYEARREIWLLPVKVPNHGKLLYKFERNADALFSPDERWIVVNDNAGSNIAEIVLFERVKGIQYARTTKGDPTISAWGLLESQNRISIDGMGHVYSEVREWASDSKSFIVVLWGHTDSEHHIDDWFCTFDLQTMKAYLTPEQREKNKGAVHFDTLK